MRWRPPETISKVPSTLEPGTLIAYNYAAWRVITVEPDGDECRIEVELVHGHAEGQRARLITRRFALIAAYRHQRIALCSCCNSPYPCRDQQAELEAKEATELMEQRMVRAAIPGTCYACGEPITTRQRSIAYPPEEGNLQLPGYPAPRFHTRKSCAPGRTQYARFRATMKPDEPPIDV